MLHDCPCLHSLYDKIRLPLFISVSLSAIAYVHMYVCMEYGGSYVRTMPARHNSYMCIIIVFINCTLHILDKCFIYVVHTLLGRVTEYILDIRTNLYDIR